MGISHRLHSLVKYATNLVELFPECKFYMSASGCTPEFEFVHTNFSAEQLVQLGIDTTVVSCDSDEQSTTQKQATEVHKPNVCQRLCRCGMMHGWVGRPTHSTKLATPLARDGGTTQTITTTGSVGTLIAALSLTALSRMHPQDVAPQARQTTMQSKLHAQKALCIVRR